MREEEKYENELLPEEEYQIPEDIETRQKGDGKLSNSGLGGIDLPDNVQKWLLVVLVICLIGVIVWGKGTYEDRLDEKDAHIAELEKKDCAKELEVYINLIHKLQKSQSNQIQATEGGLERSREITDQYEQVDNSVEHLIKKK